MRVKDTFDQYITFQDVGLANPPGPTRMTEMSLSPWTTVHVDLYGLVPSTEYRLVGPSIGIPDSPMLKLCTQHEHLPSSRI